MKKRVVAAVILLAVLFCLYRGVDHLARPEKTSTDKHDSSSSSSAAGHDAESTGLPTKVSNRPANANTHATHRPEKLKEFFLPEVAIDGLPLKAALAKLRTAYVDVCRDSGEVPVRLTFVIPPGAPRPLTVKTGIRNLDASIRLLAAMAGLKVSRTGSEYAFTAPEETGEVVKKTFNIPPDFFSRPSDENEDPFVEGAPPAKMNPAEYFASKGLSLDPSTKFSRSVTTLQVEGVSAADQIAIEGMIDLMFLKRPTRSDATELRKEIQAVVKSGEAKLLDTQILTGRSGEKCLVESIHEQIFPTDSLPPKIPDSAAAPDKEGGLSPERIKAIASLVSGPIPTSFETRNVGSTLEIEPTIGPDARIIDLLFAPELVWHDGNTTWYERKDALGNVAKIELPDFYAVRLTTSLTVTNGSYVLAGVASPRAKDGSTDLTRKVMVFVKADVLPVR